VDRTRRLGPGRGNGAALEESRSHAVEDRRPPFGSRSP
jgi:hypothetical protein